MTVHVLAQVVGGLWGDGRAGVLRTPCRGPETTDSTVNRTRRPVPPSSPRPPGVVHSTAAVPES